MSTKNINKSNLRKYNITSNKKQNKTKKAFNYSKNKSYSEETESSPSKNKKENTFDDVEFNFQKNNYDSEIVYEDEYQGLIYHPVYPDMAVSNIYYYIERDPRDEFNNFKTKWKTELCHYWEMYGQCKYGENCAFAHGDSELKKRKLTFNYKTKPCKQFFEQGYCSYGSRCQFSHKKEELKNDEEKEKEKVSYLKIIEELLSEENTISHELIKRPRLLTFEQITHCSSEESRKSRLQLYEDIIKLKNDKSKKDKNKSYKLSEDTSSNSNISSDNIKED
jgi:butyrate response factor 1